MKLLYVPLLLIKFVPLKNDNSMNLARVLSYFHFRGFSKLDLSIHM